MPPGRLPNTSRRRFLASAATVGLGATAGCLDLLFGPAGGPGGTVPTGEIPYRQDITREDADVIVDTADQLRAAVANARTDSSVSVIWIPDGILINLTGADLHIENVAVASARGAGTTGARLVTDDEGQHSPAWYGGSNEGGLISLGDNGRLTGVVVRGPHHSEQDSDILPGYIPFAPQSSRASRGNWREQRYARGVTIVGDNAIVDNCEIWAFGVQAISVGNSSVTPENVMIAFNHLHDCCMSSLGYGVDVRHGHPRIHRCLIEGCRHGVNGSGMADAGYYVTQCTFGVMTSHPIDMHGVHSNVAGSSDPSAIDYRWRAGGEMIVRDSDVMMAHVPDLPFINRRAGSTIPHVHVRGVPLHRFAFVNNRCAHNDPDGAIRQSGINGIYTPNDRGYRRLSYTGNQWGVTFTNGRTSAGARGIEAGGETIFASPMDSQAAVDRFPNTSHEGNISVVPDPAGTGRDVVAIQVPEDETRGGTLAWAPNERRDGSRSGANDPDSAFLRYYVYFPEETAMYDPSESTHGTKLPGLAGFYDEAGNGGEAGNGRSWSARLQTDVAQETTSNSAFTLNYYIYHMDQERSDGYGDLEPWHGEYSFGRWHEVTCYARMNTPGEYDGVLRGRVNGNPVFEETDYRFRSTDYPQSGITRAYAAYVYWGGSWGSPQDQNVYFRDFTVTRG